MALLTAAMIFVFAPGLGAIVAIVFAAYLALRLVFYRLLRRRVLDNVIARARGKRDVSGDSSGHTKHTHLRPRDGARPPSG